MDDNITKWKVQGAFHFCQSNGHDIDPKDIFDHFQVSHAAGFQMIKERPPHLPRPNESTKAMEAAPSARTISRSSFFEILERYEQIISREAGPDAAKPDSPPDTLQTLVELDRWRLQELPQTLEGRQKEDSDGASLTKDEVIQLTRWKLKHGTFRPSIMKLVTSNSPEDVERITRKAFKEHTSDPSPSTAGLATLCSLKGIGPATASLLLSVYDPPAVPFFSDEAYRWVMYEDGKGKGWDRVIKYDAKSYDAYFTEVQNLRERFVEEGPEGEGKISAGDVERVGYVLGKEAAMGTKRGSEKRKASEADPKENNNDEAKPVSAGKKARAKASSSDQEDGKGPAKPLDASAEPSKSRRRRRRTTRKKD